MNCSTNWPKEPPTKENGQQSLSYVLDGRDDLEPDVRDLVAQALHDVSLVFNNAGVMALGARYVSSGEHDLDELVEMVGRPDVVYEAPGVVGVAMDALARRLDEAQLAFEKMLTTPTTWVCSPRRSDRSVKRSGTSRRPSRISR
jgi:hypothetical protein